MSRLEDEKNFHVVVFISLDNPLAVRGAIRVAGPPSIPTQQEQGSDSGKSGEISRQQQIAHQRILYPDKNTHFFTRLYRVAGAGAASAGDQRSVRRATQRRIAIATGRRFMALYEEVEKSASAFNDVSTTATAQAQIVSLSLAKVSCDAITCSDHVTNVMERRGFPLYSSIGNELKMKMVIHDSLKCYEKTCKCNKYLKIN